MSNEQWDSLDAAARTNLAALPASLSEFFRYKSELRDEGRAWEGDAQEILSGFIWGEIEESDEGDSSG